MAVTEIAILRANSGEINESLRERLKISQSIQDKWHAKHFPNVPSPAADRGAAMFQQVEDPAKIFITAKWESVEAHWRWIGSDDNKSTMEDLKKDISEGDDNVVVFHVKGELFSQAAREGSVHLLDSPFISIGRLSVEDKQAFTAKWDEVVGILQDFLKPNLVRYGWREDKEAEDKEEFVLACGWETVEQHSAFRSSPGWSRYSEIIPLVAKADIKHFKRFQ